MILNAIYTVLIIFILIGIGFFISHRKWVDRTAVQAFSKIVMNFSLPSQLLVSFSQNFTAKELLKSGPLILGPLLANLLLFALSWAIAAIIKVDKKRRGVFSVLFALSNSVFIGFPVAQALFGDAGMPYATFFYFSNTLCFWTIGYYSIKKDAQHRTGEVQKITVGEILKKVVSVPLIVIVITVALILLDIPLPALIMKPAVFLGNLTTPLSMLFIGCVLYDAGFKKMKMEKDLIYVLLGRFVISSLAMYGACLLFGIGGLAKNVLLTQITLPSMTSTIIVSDVYNADSDFAAKGMAWTTVLSLITIPLVTVIFAL